MIAKMLLSNSLVKLYAFYMLLKKNIKKYCICCSSKQIIVILVPIWLLLSFVSLKLKTMTNIQEAFTKHCIVPDVINIAPSELVEVNYSNGIKVELGNELAPTQVKNKPVTLKWASKSGEYYTLAMVDPDAPSRESPKFREWHHWLVGNIFENDMGQCEVLSDYIGSGPPKGTGLHRYVFLVYRQPEKLNFSKVPKLPNNSGDKRGKFSISKFAEEYNLGSPVAGNFYEAQYDDYVPKLYAKLK